MGDDGSSDDDSTTFNTEDSGVVTWSDTDGTTGSLTSAGGTVVNADGSMMAMDNQGNQAYFDAQGNPTDENGNPTPNPTGPVTAPHGSAHPAAQGSDDAAFRMPSDIREPDWSN